MNYDKILSNFFLKDDWHFNRDHCKLYTLKKKHLNNIKNYIENRYNDSLSFKETIYRMYYNIIDRPHCKICGNDVKFVGKSSIIFRQYCCNRCAGISTETIIKKQLSDKSKHNGKLGWNHNTQEKNQKRLNTIYKKYGGMSYFKEKVQSTCIQRYGSISPLNVPEIMEKRIQTYKKNFNVENVTQSQYYKEKSYFTKKNNKTFNTSKTESETYLLLKNKFNEVIWQFSSDKYPFLCDFYIPKLDLYIECNYHWTHGKKLYEGNEEDNLILRKWKEKNTKYYKQAIYVWTDLDIRKHDIALKNNLNYLVFYNISEFKEWINKKEED